MSGRQRQSCVDPQSGKARRLKHGRWEKAYAIFNCSDVNLTKIILWKQDIWQVVIHVINHIMDIKSKSPWLSRVKVRGSIYAITTVTYILSLLNYRVNFLHSDLISCYYCYNYSYSKCMWLFFIIYFFFSNFFKVC